MARYKENFELEDGSGKKITGSILIVGHKPKFKPYVTIKLYRANEKEEHKHGFIKDKDLERFAVNILKALQSKKLK